MSTTLLAPKISSSGTATGVITRIPVAADEVRLIVLNSLGEVASETRKSVSEQGFVALSFDDQISGKAGNQVHFLVVKGYLKGAPAFEQRLGRFRFHA